MQYLCNICAISVQYLCNICAISVQYLCNICAISVQYLCNICAISVQYLCNICAILHSPIHLPEDSTKAQVNLLFHFRTCTKPLLPSTRTYWPSFNIRVAFSMPTTAGIPYSRAMTEPCVIIPPISTTRA